MTDNKEKIVIKLVKYLSFC